MDSRSLTSVQQLAILATHWNAGEVLETASHATPVEAETSSAENHGRTLDSHPTDSNEAFFFPPLPTRGLRAVKGLSLMGHDMLCERNAARY